MAPAKLVEAPTFYPTEKEFEDPLEYIDKITPQAEKYGLCRVVPPKNFKVREINSFGWKLNVGMHGLPRIPGRADHKARHRTGNKHGPKLG